MIKATKLVLLPLVLALGTAGFAQAYENCAAKRAAIEYQISQAKAHGNYHKVVGLEQALAKVNMYCGVNNGSNVGGDYTGAIIAKLEQKVEKLEKKVFDKQSDVREIEYDLNKAQAKGDYKKIAKLQKKLAEKKSDVAEIQAELESVRAELAAAKR